MTKVEWEWNVIDGIYVPVAGSSSVGYEVPGGRTCRVERESKLENCVLNRPLDPHQFDHAGLGMADGDLIIDEREARRLHHQGRRAGEARGLCRAA